MNVKNKKTIGYFFLGFLSVFVFSFTLFYIFESKAIIVKIDDIKKEEKQLVKFQETLVTEKLRLVIGDLKYLENTYSDKLYFSNNLKNVAKDWKEFSIQNPHYDQIRYLDEFGNEVIRINKNGASAEILDPSQLQNKSDRYYFKETKQLDKDGVFVSPFDLNIEFNEIEIPPKPMIRFASPLYDNENNFKGIIILNYLGQNILDDFRSLASNSNGTVSLVNSDGYWISCESSKYNFNFMFNDKKTDSFKSLYPQEWTKIVNNNHQFLTDNGLFTSLNLELNNKPTSKKNYEEIIETKDRWTVVSKVDKNKVSTLSFWHNPISTVKQIFNNNGLALSIITFISLLSGILAYLNKKSYCMIKFFSEYDLLTNAYNRRAGLAKLEKLTYNRDKKVKNFSLCFLDVNGLKKVNDSLGHDYGDQLLIIVYKIILDNVRSDDILLRYGGDEFILVIKDTSIEKANVIWQRINNAFKDVNENEDLLFNISVSHGIVEFSSSENISLNELIEAADKKMYEEKKILNKSISVLK